MVSLIFSIIVVAIVVGLLLWLISFIGSQFPQIAQPILAVAKVLVVVVAVLWLISILLSFTGVGTLNLK